MESLTEAYARLRDAYGPQGWWPAATRDGVAAPWEVMVGAVLVQHTSWKNVVKAIATLEAANAMTVAAIDALEPAALAKMIRSAGPPNVKAKRLKALAAFLVAEHGGSADALVRGVADAPVAQERRAQLLAVHGIGPETADAILLYGGGAPLFVVDAYKRRVMARHGWDVAEAPYDEVAARWRESLAPDAGAYQEAHALLVRVGVEHCRKPTPRCEGCPLAPMLPAGGPRPD